MLTRCVYSNLLDVLQGKAERIITLDQVRRQVAVLEEAHAQNELWQTPGEEWK